MTLRQAKFTLTAAEVTALLLPYYRTRYLSKKNLSWLFLGWFISMLAVIAFVVGLGGLRTLVLWENAIIKIAIIYLFIIALLAWLKLWFFIPRQVKALIAKDKQIGLEQTVKWDEHNLSIRSSYIKGTYPFRLIFDWREDSSCFALYLDRKHFKILPKASLTAEQMSDLREILSREVVSPA